jgi:isatin hydrolase
VTTTLTTLIDDLNARRLRVIDLTQPLGPDTPVIDLPPIFAASPGVTDRKSVV